MDFEKENAKKRATPIHTLSPCARSDDDPQGSSDLRNFTGVNSSHNDQPHHHKLKNLGIEQPRIGGQLFGLHREIGWKKCGQFNGFGSHVVDTPCSSALFVDVWFIFQVVVDIVVALKIPGPSRQNMQVDVLERKLMVKGERGERRKKVRKEQG